MSADILLFDDLVEIADLVAEDAWATAFIEPGIIEELSQPVEKLLEGCTPFEVVQANIRQERARDYWIEQLITIDFETEHRDAVLANFLYEDIRIW